MDASEGASNAPTCFSWELRVPFRKEGSVDMRSQGPFDCAGACTPGRPGAPRGFAGDALNAAHGPGDLQRTLDAVRGVVR